MKTRFASVGTRRRHAGLAVLAAMIVAGLFFAAGCATHQDHPNAPVSRKDLAEYRQLAEQAHEAISAALQALDRAVARTPCPPGTLKALTRDVNRLEVDSFKIRARGQAVRTRGRAYFDQWHERMAQADDPATRAAAERCREQLRERFSRIGTLTEESREAFQPFMTGLRRLRNGIENDPAVAGTETMKQSIRATREHGQKVEAGVAAILAEIDAVAVILKNSRKELK